MNKILFKIITPLVFVGGAFSQSSIDTVSIGSGYTNQTWYSLENQTIKTELKTGWDLAFNCSGFGTSIHINASTGTSLWSYPNGDISKWDEVDTSGIKTWKQNYNSDTSWVYGALDKGEDINNPMDLGWGIYSTITHIVTGDSIFIIKLSNNEYKKLAIESLSGGVFTFKYADIDGANLENATFTKSNFVGKNFGYYSLQTNQEIDREPLLEDWDLVFTQYIAFVPSPYLVTGILTNPNHQAAKVINVEDTIVFNDYLSANFSSEINVLGWDWKSFNMATYKYDIADSTVHFIKRDNGDIWKIILLGFEGSSSGKFIFSKEKLETASIENLSNNNQNSLLIYPNPFRGNELNIVSDIKQKSDYTINIYDMYGQIIYTKELGLVQQGFYNFKINDTDFQKGMYFVELKSNEGEFQIQQKLVVN